MNGPKEAAKLLPRMGIGPTVQEEEPQLPASSSFAPQGQLPFLLSWQAVWIIPLWITTVGLPIIGLLLHSLKEYSHHSSNSGIFYSLQQATPLDYPSLDYPTLDYQNLDYFFKQHSTGKMLSHIKSVKELQEFVNYCTSSPAHAQVYLLRPEIRAAIQERYDQLRAQGDTRILKLPPQPKPHQDMSQYSEGPSMQPSRKRKNIWADDDDEDDQFYEKSDWFHQKMKVVRGEARAFKIGFKNLHKAKNVEKVVKGALDDCLRSATSRAPKNSRVGVSISSTSLDTDIIIPFTKKGDRTTEHIMRVVEKVKQSKKGLSLEEAAYLQFTTLEPAPTAHGWSLDRVKGHWEKWFEQDQKSAKPCLKDFGSQGDGGHLCFLDCCILGKAFIMESNKVYNSLVKAKKNNSPRWQATVDVLLKECDIEHIRTDGSTYEDWKKVEEKMLQPEICLTVRHREQLDAKIYHGGVREGTNQKNLQILLANSHAYFIKLPLKYFNKSFYCLPCGTAYDHTHSCMKTCYYCHRQQTCTKGDPRKYCTGCHKDFYNDQCFQVHLEKNQAQVSICDKFKICPSCRTHYSTEKRDHKCGQRYCQKCNKMVYENKERHYCYLSKLEPITIKPKKDEEEQPLVMADNNRPMDQQDPRMAFIVFDFECKAELVIQEDVRQHQPNLIMALKFCMECGDSNEEEPNCRNCHKREHPFQGPDALEKFCAWLFDPKVNYKALAFAHNGRGYDFHFIARHLTVVHGMAPEIIMKGRKIMSLSLAGVKLIDSLSFFTMPLKALPKTFNLQGLEKGDFPHLFNKTENEGYTGAYPALEYYDLSSKSKKEKEELTEWHKTKEGQQFDFWKELKKYCLMDCQILKAAIWEFYTLIMKLEGVNPYSVITLPSLTMKIFRRNHLLSSEILGITPARGYNPKERHSRLATAYLDWISQERGINIRHAENGGEVKMNGYSIDGVWQDEAWEINGCLWHGCPICFPNRDQKLPDSPKTVQDAYDLTLRKEAVLRVKFRKLHVVWEHQINSEKGQSKEMASFFKSHRRVQPMDTREFFFGGHTESYCIHYERKQDEQIDYLDVCSLYPTVLKRCEYPVGHPRVITSFDLPTTQEDVKKYQGIIKATVLPPQGLLHPTLPCKVEVPGGSTKLMFPLCRSCGESQIEEDCPHTTEDERAITGAWPHNELLEAVDQGYKIIQLHEVWQFDKFMKYNGEDPESGMFTKYINNFLKLKTQASGWPEWVLKGGEEAKDKFIDDYLAAENITLDKEMMQYNAGLRAIAKLMLNSFWGKFGQKLDRLETKFAKSTEEANKIIYNQTLELHQVSEVSPNLVQISFKKRKEFVHEDPTTSTVIAAYVTSHARLYHGQYLKKMGHRALYVDTDSIICVTREGQERLPIGDKLGDLTSELPDEGSTITTFISGGAKNYSYRGVDSKGQQFECCKVRGFTLKSEDAQLTLNFARMKEAVLQYKEDQSQLEEPIVIKKAKIDRNRFYQVLTRPEAKQYGIVFNKRRLLPNGFSVPFGYHLANNPINWEG